MQKIDWCKGGLQLADIGTKNVSEPDIIPRMKYIMVRLGNGYRSILKEGLYSTGQSMEQELRMTILYLVEDSTQLVWNVWKT